MTGEVSWKVLASVASFEFLLYLPSWIPGYTWTSFILKFQFYPKNSQENSQKTEINEGRQQTFQLRSQNCQLGVYRMTLKSPQMKQSFKYNSSLHHWSFLLRNPCRIWEKKQCIRKGFHFHFHNSLILTLLKVQEKSSSWISLDWSIGDLGGLFYLFCFLHSQSNYPFWVSILPAFQM